MSDNQTTRCAVSGAHLFACYARTCCENGSEGNGGRSDADISLLLDFVLRNDLADEEPLQQLLCRMFPDPVKECFSSDGNSKGNPVDFIWPISLVRTYWRHTHTGPKSDVTSSRPENGCRTIRAKVLRKHPSVEKVYEVEVEGEKVFVIDLFDLKPTPGEFVYFHQHIICEIDDDQADTKQSCPQLQSITVEHVDSAFVGTFAVPTGCRSLVDEEDPGDVQVGVPATVLPPISEKPCDCDHECKGGHPCPRAPIMIQTGGPEPVESVLFGNSFDGNPS